MTRAQRRRHLLVWAVLLPAMLAGLVAALAVRPARPVQEAPGTAPGPGGAPR